MVRSLEMSEVPRSFLNEQMHRLADEAFPDHDDPMQQELWSQYMRLATAFVVDALKMNDKVILEVIFFSPSVSLTLFFIPVSSATNFYSSLLDADCLLRHLESPFTKLETRI